MQKRFGLLISSLFLGLAGLIGLPGCQGPRSGFWGELRRINRLREAEGGEVDPAEPPGERIAFFPLWFHERTEKYVATEVLWPFFQSGSGERADYFHFWPLLKDENFPEEKSFVLFPFFWHGRKTLESGEVACDHFWPFVGVHREPLDLHPATTIHVAWPLFFWRQGGREQWRACVFPVLDLSQGYIDRGWWLFPVVKIGGDRRGNGWFFLADPLIAWERHSIAEEGEELTGENSRSAFLILGGLLGWERLEGIFNLRFFWIRFY